MQSFSENTKNCVNNRRCPAVRVPKAKVVGQLRQLEQFSHRATRLRLPRLREKRRVIANYKVRVNAFCSCCLINCFEFHWFRIPSYSHIPSVNCELPQKLQNTANSTFYRFTRLLNNKPVVNAGDERRTSWDKRWGGEKLFKCCGYCLCWMLMIWLWRGIPGKCTSWIIKSCSLQRLLWMELSSSKKLTSRSFKRARLKLIFSNYYNLLQII